MLTEYKNVRQIIGEPRRRWFSDDFFDLIVWFSKENFILGFQLCYDMGGSQRALTWKRPDAYFHQRIDDGEGRPGKHKATPILVPDGRFNYKLIASRFQKESVNIEPVISKFIYNVLSAYQI
jgi:hypothetical protein